MSYRRRRSLVYDYGVRGSGLATGVALIAIRCWLGGMADDVKNVTRPHEFPCQFRCHERV
jgi:hypothetical protein